MQGTAIVRPMNVGHGATRGPNGKGRSIGNRVNRREIDEVEVNEKKNMNRVDDEQRGLTVVGNVDQTSPTTIGICLGFADGRGDQRE